MRSQPEKMRFATGVQRGMIAALSPAVVLCATIGKASAGEWSDGGWMQPSDGVHLIVKGRTAAQREDAKLKVQTATAFASCLMLVGKPQSQASNLFDETMIKLARSYEKHWGANLYDMFAVVDGRTPRDVFNLVSQALPIGLRPFGARLTDVLNSADSFGAETEEYPCDRRRKTFVGRPLGRVSVIENSKGTSVIDNDGVGLFENRSPTKPADRGQSLGDWPAAKSPPLL